MVSLNSWGTRSEVEEDNFSWKSLNREVNLASVGLDEHPSLLSKQTSQIHWTFGLEPSQVTSSRESLTQSPWNQQLQEEQPIADGSESLTSFLQAPHLTEDFEFNRVERGRVAIHSIWNYLIFGFSLSSMRGNGYASLTVTSFSGGKSLAILFLTITMPLAQADNDGWIMPSASKLRTS